MRIGETYDEALQKAAELMQYYNGKLKTCKTSEDVINLYKEYWDDPEVSGGVPSIRTIRGYKPINNFFRTKEPDVVEYICDSDVAVRKCKVQNLYRFVKFDIRIPERWFEEENIMNGFERNKQSVEALFSANIKDMEYYVDISDDYGKLKQEYFYTKEDAIDFANKKNNIQGLSAKVYDKFGKQIKSSRRPIKSEYEDEDDSEVTEFYVSLGECGYDGTITVTKEEDGKWHGEDGAVFMGYLTPEEIVEWYDKDYGSAWLCNSRRPIKSAADTLHCVYVSGIWPQHWTKQMALSAIKNSVTNYGCYDYNGRTGMILVGDFDDIHSFIESNGMVVDEDYIYHWKEFDWDSAKKLDKRYIGEKPNNVVSSRRPIESAQEPLYWGDEHDQRGINMYTREEYIEKYGEEPPEWKRVTEIETDLWNSRRPIKSSKYYTSHNNWKYNTSVLPVNKREVMSFFEDGSWNWDDTIAIVGEVEGASAARPAVIFGSKGKYEKLEKGTGLFNGQSWNDIGYFSFHYYNDNPDVFEIPNCRYFVLK